LRRSRSFSVTSGTVGPAPQSGEGSKYGTRSLRLVPEWWLKVPDAENAVTDKLCSCLRTGRGHELDMVTDKSRSRSVHGLDTDMFADRSRSWTVRGHGQTAVVVADWMRSRTAHGRGCGLDTATARRPDNGADISRLNRDHFADIRTLRMQGVRRPLLNSHKSCEPSHRIFRIGRAACWSDVRAR
jgi:hypothetical protein